jgi:hypothetical protein
VAFLIFKLLDGGQQVWLKRYSPVITWGPREQAHRYRSALEARLALTRLPRQERASLFGDGG